MRPYNLILSLLAISLSFQSFGQISGLQTVHEGQSVQYTYSASGPVTNGLFYPSNNKGTASPTSVNGNTYTTTIFWTTTGTEALMFMDGQIPLSGPYAITVLAAPPPVPTLNNASSVSSSSFTVSWNNVGLYATYQLDVSTASDFSTFVSGYQSLSVAGTSQVVNANISPNTQYYFRVRSRSDGSAVSTSSTPKSVTTAPATPVPLDPTNITDDSFTANWQASTGATTYSVDVYSTAFVGTWTSSGTSVTIPGRSSNTAYSYTVKAANSNGTSPASSPKYLTTAPPIPHVSAANPIGETTFTANWEVVSGATQYLLDISTDEYFADGYYVGSFHNFTISGGSTTTANITGLSPNNAYYYRLRAQNSGWTTGYSSTIDVLTRPMAPTTGDPNTITNNSFVATWSTVSGITNFRIDVAKQNINNEFGNYATGWYDAPVTGTSATVTGLSGGTVYYYHLRSENATGSSLVSSAAKSLITIPDAPIIQGATNVTSTSFTANWLPSYGADTYRIYVSDNDFDSNLPNYDGVYSGTTNLPVSNLTPGRIYKYKVKAVNVSGFSEFSAPATVTTFPASPIALAATNISDESFSANWQPAIGATTYLIDVYYTSTNNFIGTWTSSETTVSIPGRTGNTGYYYRIRAANSNTENNISAPSSPIYLTTLPPVPHVSAADPIGETTFTAHWETVDGATQYLLDISEDENFGSYFGNFHNFTMSGGSTTTANITGLSGNEHYYYRVRAQNSGWTSGYSDTITVLTLPPAPGIGNPTLLTNNSFKAHWSTVSGITNFRIDVATNIDNMNHEFSNFAPNWYNVAVTGTSANITGLTGGTTYYYHVRAENSTGQSVNSDYRSVLTTPDPPIIGTPTDITSTSFTANWGYSNSATGYRLYVSDDDFNTTLSNYDGIYVGALFKSVTDLDPGHTYTYKVKAFNDSGDSPFSEPNSVLLRPGKPLIQAASEITTSTFKANWGSVYGASNYRLIVATDEDFNFPYPNYNNITVSDTSHTVQNLLGGETYYYKVKAHNNSGNSEYSEYATVLTVPPVPVPIQASNFTATSFQANWNPANSATSYRLDVSSDSEFTTKLSGYDDLLVVAGSSQNVSGLSEGSMYYYRVRATNASGTSESSDPFTTLTTPPAPLSPTATDITTTSFNMSWGAATSAISYHLFISTESDFSSYVDGYSGLETTELNHAVTGLTPSTTYYCKVNAQNSSGPSEFSATIIVTTDGLFIGMNANYIVTNNIQVGDITQESQVIYLNATENIQSVQYFDGLGRASQSVSTQASPSRLDLTMPFVYDEYGRQKLSYLPFEAQENNGRLKAILYDANGDYYDDFYNGNGAIAADDRPFSETTFEPSPLNRPLTSMGPGEDWYTNNKAVHHAYLTNVHGNSAAGEERVIAWVVNSSGMPVRAAVLTSYVETGGYVSSSQLSIKSTKDEEDHEVREYTDKLGRVILKKVQAVSGSPTTHLHTDWAHTYYIYDDLGNLRFVLQPNLSAQLHTDGDDPTQTELDELAFQYTYDERRRMVTKQVPGAGAVYMIYDKRDRLVMTQDAVQRTNFEWLYTKYDQLNRPIITGIYTHGSDVSRTTMEGTISTTAFSENYNGTAATFGYTNNLFPTTGTKVLTVTYYDNYSFKTMLNVSNDDYFPNEVTDQAPASDRVIGQVTGSQTNILGTTSYLWSVAYYDEKYRTIQSISQNHLGGYDRTTNAYDFAGRVTESLTTHVKGPATTTVKRRFAYDHASRLTKVWHKVGTEDEVLLVHNLYDELGRLKRKALYGANADAGGAPFKKGDNQYGYDIEVSQYKNEKKIIARNSVKLLPGFSFKAENGKTLTIKLDDEEVKAAAAKLTASGYQAVDYRYNIRGWLERINKSNLSQEESGDPVDYFGMNLGYQKALSGTNNSPAWNGNISATRWSVNLGLAKNNPYLIPEFDERAYKYSYDAMNRLTAATHRVKTTVWGGSGSLHENGITYDLNGNIKTLVRKSAFNEGIDNLAYTYNTGNKLMKVADSDDATKGFIDGANSGDDYAYDPNGNMVQDLNKSINSGGIVYNHLNLPSEVNKTTNEKIEYLYDASGRKLQQKVYDSGSQLIKTTDYDGEFVYEGGLQFILHEEGRFLPSGEYEYFLKDHLGNNRMTFTTQPELEDFLITFEDPSVGNAFSPSYADANIMSGTNHTPGGNHAQRLSGMLEDPSYPGKNLMVGLAKSFPVVPGDTISVEVQAMYVGSEGSGSDVEDLLFSGIAAAFGVSAASTGDGKILYDNLGNVNGETYFAKNGDDNGSAPDAYLNYILFDKDYVFYDLGFIPISTAANATWERLAVDIFPRQPGFVYIYLSNENDNIIDVFFDDLKIDYQHSPVMQADDYYPFGLAFNSYQRENSTKNDYLYNGKELQEDLDLNWYDYGARMYMADLGRWGVVDPKAALYFSATPYNYVLNQPTQAIDPDGMACKGCGENGEDILPPEVNGQPLYIGTSADGAGETPPDDIYYRHGKEVKRDVNGKPDRHYELQENDEYSTGEEAVQIQNPNRNPSSMQSTNKTGYTYTEKDIKVRNSLLGLGSSNILTATMLRWEKSGNFQPLSQFEYYRYYTGRWGTDKAFYFAIEEGYFYVPGAGGANGGALSRSSLAGYQKGLSKFSKSMSEINRPGGGFSPAFKVNLRNSAQPRNQWNRFQKANRGKFSNSSEASKEYNRIMTGGN